MGFIKRHKKLVIITSLILTVILTLIILIFTVFSLKDISLNFKTETNVLSEEVQEEIVDTLRNEGVSTVLFIYKDRIVNDLEKKFPYLKIVNIETVFPSSFIVHCLEREEFYAIESNEKVYYLDEDLKILKIEDGNFLNTPSNAVLLDIADLNLNITDAEEGQFLNFGSQAEDNSAKLATYSQEVLTNLLTCFEQSNRDIAIVKSSYESFTLNLKYQEVDDNRTWYVCLSLKYSLGLEFEIIEANEKLAEKLEVMINLIDGFSVDNPDKLTSGKISIYENSSNQIVYSE